MAILVKRGSKERKRKSKFRDLFANNFDPATVEKYWNIKYNVLLLQLASDIINKALSKLQIKC